MKVKVEIMPKMTFSYLKSFGQVPMQCNIQNLFNSDDWCFEIDVPLSINYLWGCAQETWVQHWFGGKRDESPGEMLDALNLKSGMWDENTIARSGVGCL